MTKLFTELFFNFWGADQTKITSPIYSATILNKNWDSLNWKIRENDIWKFSISSFAGKVKESVTQWLLRIAGSLALKFSLQRTIVIRKWLEFWLAFALQWKFQSQGASVTLPRSQRYTRAISLQPFFGGSADFEINFWHSKRKLMAFSCLIHFSSVPPQCVMLWWSREKFFSRHYRDVKL